MTQPTWPPSALRPDALGQLYNEAYAKAIERGLSIEDAHQAGCFAVHTCGYEYAVSLVEETPRYLNAHMPLCTCTDGRCLVVETEAAAERGVAHGSSPR